VSVNNKRSVQQLVGQPAPHILRIIGHRVRASVTRLMEHLNRVCWNLDQVFDVHFISAMNVQLCEQF